MDGVQAVGGLGGGERAVDVPMVGVWKVGMAMVGMPGDERIMGESWGV